MKHRESCLYVHISEGGSFLLLLPLLSLVSEIKSYEARLHRCAPQGLPLLFVLLFKDSSGSDFLSEMNTDFQPIFSEYQPREA